MAQVWGAVAQQESQEPLPQQEELDAHVAAVAQLRREAKAAYRAYRDSRDRLVADRLVLERMLESRRRWADEAEKKLELEAHSMKGLAMRIGLAIADFRAGKPAEVAGEPPVAPPQSTQTAEEEATPQTEEWQQASSSGDGGSASGSLPQQLVAAERWRESDAESAAETDSQRESGFRVG